MIRDVTDQKTLETQKKLAASVFTAADEGICITDPDGLIVQVNEAFCKITGYDRDELIGNNPRLLQSGQQDAAFYEEMWQSLLTSGTWRGEVWNRRKDGEVYPEILTISAVTGDDGNVKNYVGISSDITSIKSHEDELLHMVQFDALTSLPNRVLLADRLKQEIASTNRTGKILAVAYIDLDGFKKVNDTYGHAVGDDLLVAVANRLNALIRGGDTLARIGGDEFVAVYSDIEEPKDILPILGRFLVSCSDPFLIGELTINISASIGVTYYPQPAELDGDQLQRQADQAMYQAKLTGKNCYKFYDADLDNKVKINYEMANAIEKAIALKEFQLYYQPKANLTSGQIIGVEALIRWNSPKRGLLRPDLFLPHIEGHHVYLVLADWVMETVLCQMETWANEGLLIPVSVNIGAIQLLNSGFDGWLRDKLSEHPLINPAMLELEILETSALEDIDRVASVIVECKKLGVNFSIDDFGTGYSSLLYLKALPVDTLKIDQQFVRTMINNPKDASLLKGMIEMAEDFELKAIAEGVETHEHSQLLVNLDCKYGQGYYIARPMSASAFKDWIKGRDLVLPHYN